MKMVALVDGGTYCGWNCPADVCVKIIVRFLEHLPVYYFFIMMLHHVIAVIYLRMGDILRTKRLFLPPVSYVASSLCHFVQGCGKQGFSRTTNKK
jgi:hypothetical protein